MEVVRLYEGSVNGDVVWDHFLNYVVPVLNPYLEGFVLPNSLLILDNVSAMKLFGSVQFRVSAAPCGKSLVLQAT